MTPRQRERMKSYAVALVTAILCVLLGGLRNTLEVAALCAVVWLCGYYLPLTIMVKRARRKG